MSRAPHLPPLPPALGSRSAVLACLSATAAPVPARWLRCWVCRCPRWRWDRAALRCLRCRAAYLATPAAGTWPLPLERERCPRCAGGALGLGAAWAGCLRCGWEWALAAGPLTIHLAADEDVRAGFQLLGILKEDGTPGPALPSGTDPRADLRKLRRGLDPLTDYRQRVPDLAARRRKFRGY